MFVLFDSIMSQELIAVFQKVRLIYITIKYLPVIRIAKQRIERKDAGFEKKLIAFIWNHQL